MTKKQLKLRSKYCSDTDAALYRKAVDILGGSDDAIEKLNLLMQGHAALIFIDHRAGSHKEASDQLSALAIAADNMIVALKNLRGAGWQALSEANPELMSHYESNREELTALASLCREKSRGFATKASSGVHTAARSFQDFQKSPAYELAQGCATFIEFFHGDLDKTKELTRIVEEIVTGVKPKPRWAERECREAKRFAQTLSKVAQSSV
ncbi:hypothetical protein [Geothrix terrae]|uniref:hypothetical protein n=1 Tax=Geothrix terrae TaxID=2922720 RepID=UPI001FAC306E|nr:hypothetical protein [Geothrix terrae]